MDLACRSFLVALAASCAAGCAGTPPPSPFGVSSSIVGVRITTVPPIGIFSYDCNEAFFVRVDSGEPTQQSIVIRSNYHDGDYTYLLNAEAGTYAVVAGRVFRQHGETYTTYLPEEVVRQSLVTVAEADVAFMGEFKVKSSTKLDAMDKAQAHYIGVIQPGERGGGFPLIDHALVHLGDRPLSSSTYTYRGTLKNADQSPIALERFLGRAEKKLAEHGWAEVLRGRAAESGATDQ